MSTNFWSTHVTPPPLTGNTPPVDMDDAVGIIRNIPGTISGSLTASYTNAARAVNALATVTIDAGATRPELDQFSLMHSDLQAAWIRHEGGFMLFPQNPQGTDKAGSTAIFALTHDDTRPINLQNMSLTDYHALPLVDQRALQTTMTSSGITDRLGLSADKATVNTVINDAKAQITSLVASSATLVADRMSEKDMNLFIRQLDLLAASITNSPLVAENAVSAAVSDIVERFLRAHSFHEVKDPLSVTSWTLKKKNDTLTVSSGLAAGQDGFKGVAPNAVSSDGNTTIKNGYAAFIKAEEAILTAKLRRDALSRAEAVRDPKLDAANLIYQFQMLYESQAEGVADAGTEEIRQLHKLLQDYGIMQQLLNETLKAFDPKKEGEKRRFMNLGGEPGGGIVTRQSDSDRDSSLKLILTSPTDTIDAPYQDTPIFHWLNLAYPDTQTNNTGDEEQPGTNPFSQYDETRPARNVKNGAGLSFEQMAIFSMFSADSWTSRQPHPIESYFGIARPVHDFVDETSGSLKLMRNTEYNGFLTQLNDTVTLLNQKAQLKQNDIDSASRQQNRHFDLANNALRKMNDMLASIARM